MSARLGSRKAFAAEMAVAASFWSGFVGKWPRYKDLRSPKIVLVVGVGRRSAAAALLAAGLIVGARRGEQLLLLRIAAHCLWSCR